MNTAIPASPTALPLWVLVRRMVALSAVCGFVEVIGYMDVGNIYPAIMTGNTVQLGWSLANKEWVRFATIGFAIGSFFIGCMISSLVRRRLKRPTMELVIMASLLVVIGFVREYEALRVPVELPLLALALSMLGVTVSRFGGVSLQTIVVTNNMVKFSDSFVGRYLSGSPHTAKRPELKEVLLPGLAWLTYSLAAALGAQAYHLAVIHFIFPVTLLLLVSIDLVRRPDSE